MFGGDYETPDGTGVRDFIHVVDLAVGHVKAVERINEKCGCKAYNLGTGIGYSVLDMVKAMEDASGKKIEYKIVVCCGFVQSLVRQPLWCCSMLMFVCFSPDLCGSPSARACS